MNYNKQQIKEGICLHQIETSKFKTNLLSVFITTPLSRENVTLDAMIPAVLRRGSENMQTQEEISKKLEEMYGASFDCGIEKTGDNHVIKLYLETINDDFLPQKEDILEKGISKILEIAFNPLTQNGTFKEEYVNAEKENLKNIIEGKIDNKAKYALDRCIEEMYKDKPYGLYRYGYIEDLENINAKNLYKYYRELISEAKIDIFVSGKNIQNAQNIISNNKQIVELNERKPIYITNNVGAQSVTNPPEKYQIAPKTIAESMDITQGKLVIGLDILDTNEESKYIALVYNAILGGSANSKMFQNVREKASLAYTAGSTYLRQKNNIFVRCGIEIQNYEKALEIINEQIEDMKKGNFTDEDLQNARANIISTIKFIPDEQDTGITYYFGQELSNIHVSFEEYIEKINNVTKEQIIKLANKINTNTIYFLKD